MDDLDLSESCLMSLTEILLHKGRNLLWRKGMEIDEVLNREGDWLFREAFRV